MDKIKNTLLKGITKLISVYFVLLLFFITIYNFTFEWLTIAIDSSILVVVLIITLVTFIRREYHLLIYRKIKGMLHVRITIGIERIVDIVDSFNIKFFNLLSYKKFIYLAMIGILMLHLITEAGIFIIPYVVGATDPTYFSELGEGHTPILNLIAPLQSLIHKHQTKSLLSAQIGGLSLLSSIPITLVYLMNIFSILFLLINPLIIWLHMYKERQYPAHAVKPITSKLYSVFQCIFVISVSAIIFTPIFGIEFASKKVFGGTEIIEEYTSSIRGIDIQTHLIENYSYIPLVLTIGVLLAASYIMLSRKYKKQITSVINITNLTFILAYLSIFYWDIHNFFIATLKSLYSTNLFFFMHFALFFVMSSLFYLIGILLLSIELFARGEIYIPLPAIKIIKPLYSALEKLYHHLLPHHHLPHLIFYDHYIEAEHGKKEEHLHKHIAKIIHTTHKNQDLLVRIIKKGVKEGKHELYFIEEHLLEHNWPKIMVAKAVERARKDPELRKKLLAIKREHHAQAILERLARSVQQWYNKGHSLERIFLHAKKQGWTEEDIREIIPQLKLKRKDRIIFKAYKL